jgi:hypothetical protein
MIYRQIPFMRPKNSRLEAVTRVNQELMSARAGALVRLVTVWERFVGCLSGPPDSLDREAVTRIPYSRLHHH